MNFHIDSMPTLHSIPLTTDIKIVHESCDRPRASHAPPQCSHYSLGTVRSYLTLSHLLSGTCERASLIMASTICICNHAHRWLMHSEIHPATAPFTCAGFFYSESVLTQCCILGLLGVIQGGSFGVSLLLFRLFLAALGIMVKCIVGSWKRNLEMVEEEIGICALRWKLCKFK